VTVSSTVTYVGIFWGLCKASKAQAAVLLLCLTLLSKDLMLMLMLEPLLRAEVLLLVALMRASGTIGWAERSVRIIVLVCPYLWGGKAGNIRFKEATSIMSCPCALPFDMMSITSAENDTIISIHRAQAAPYRAGTLLEGPMCHPKQNIPCTFARCSFLLIVFMQTQDAPDANAMRT
jgi:hypothetical protein